MIRAAVLGSPISHSLSPALHSYAYQKFGIPFEYSAIEVPSGSLHRFLDQAKSDRTWRGFSLTMPLKEEAIVECANISADAQLLQAVNTLAIEANGFQGYNTDVLGFEMLLKEIAAESISILGAGGTARAALLAARRVGLHTTVFRRTAARDAALQRIDRDVLISDWKNWKEALKDQVLLNATPHGTIVGVGAITTEFVIDALYHPWPTDLMNAVSAKTKMYTGIDLLAAQAAHQVQIFTRSEIDLPSLVQELREVGLSAIHK